SGLRPYSQAREVGYSTPGARSQATKAVGYARPLCAPRRRGAVLSSRRAMIQPVGAVIAAPPLTLPKYRTSSPAFRPPLLSLSRLCSSNPLQGEATAESGCDAEYPPFGWPARRQLQKMRTSNVLALVSN